MKLYIIVLIAFTALTTSCGKNGSFVNGEVKHAGTLKGVMSGDLKSKMDLATMEGMPNLYAVGSMAGLSGEIQIFNSKPLNSVQAEELGSIDSTYNTKAAFLIYSQVDEWQEIEVPKAILTLDQFDDFLEYTAVKAGLDETKPFPFLLEGYVRKINWHIVNWDPNMGAHSINAHKNSGLNGVAVEEAVKILGFYSKSHQGVLTHHDKNLHMHFVLKNEKLGGHLDDILLGEYMTLKLPKQ